MKPEPKPDIPESRNIEISPTRLRIGVLCVFIWWIPIWAAAPIIAGWFGISDIAKLILIMATIQTIIGGFGVVVAGKQILTLLKTIPRKKVPKSVWHMLISGKTE